VEIIRLVSLVCLIDLISRIGLIKHNGLFGFGLINHNGLIGFNGLSLNGISYIRLVRLQNWPHWLNHQISLVGRISLVSFSGLVGHNGLVSFIGIGLFSQIGFISLFGHIGLIGRISHNSLASVISLSLVSLVGLSVYWPFKLATHGVAIKLTSATKIKICNSAIWYYGTASHWFVRESWLWHVLLPTGRLDSLFSRDALQNTKQLFSLRLLQMSKYCVMRE
jgi:hypothetical protein